MKILSVKHWLDQVHQISGNCPAHQSTSANAFLHASRAAFESGLLLISYPMLRSVLHCQRADSPCGLGLTCKQDMWKHTCSAACLWLPKPWDSLWCADSGLTQRKNAMYLITSVHPAAPGSFFETFPTGITRLKAFTGNRINMKWLKANIELLKGFWQKPERAGGKQKVHSVLAKTQKHLPCAWRWHKQTQ